MLSVKYTLEIFSCYLCDYSRNDSFVVLKRKDAAQISEPLQTSVRVSKYGIIARDSSDMFQLV